ncbi:uncharacterized protein LOC133187189 [Saccostrea echinata]|uniref:uncharacterized protein LOC133187189 n=1 Tax=Saccostrea echinata TaxID=191078 RepID=UPI002A7EF3F3|nr:uncharacterized protein LOC133187189 [Saccostrea echinata]
MMLYLELLSSATGLILCVVATALPGFFTEENSKLSIFYGRICISDKCSTSSYVALDEEHNTDGTFQLSMIDVQIESLFAIVFGGVGWLILFWSSKNEVSIPSKFVTAGILLLVAVTSEFAVFIRFIAMNASRIASQGKSSSSSIGIPYSLILAGFGIIFILFAVIRSFILYIRHEGATKTNQQMVEEPWSSITENKL